MRTNSVREKLLAGQPTIGAFMGLGSPNVAELLAHAGYDWLVIETEHNGLDSAEIQHMLMAMSSTSVVPIVRIPSANSVFIQRALDMGALGILVPMVRTADEARAIVAATRYPPFGKRSFGPLRAANYGFDNLDYFNRANDNILVSFILETKEGVDNLDEIAAVDGIDAIFLGPFDLCLSLGLNPMNQPFPEIDAILKRLLEVCRKHGKAAGTGGNTPDVLRQRKAEGYNFLASGSDYFMMADAAQTAIKAVRE